MIRLKSTSSLIGSGLIGFGDSESFLLAVDFRLTDLVELIDVSASINLTSSSLVELSSMSIVSLLRV